VNEDEFIEREIQEADAGNYEAAMRIIETIYTSLINHKSPDWRYADYFANCLKFVMDGVSPKDALGLSARGRGEYDRSKIDKKNSQLAAEVAWIYLYRKENKLPSPREEALSMVSERHRIPYKTLEKAYDKHRESALAPYKRHYLHKN